MGGGIIPSMLFSAPRRRLRRLLADVTDFPVRPTALTLWERFRQDRLGLTASALTFTTVLALVPFFAVALSVFTAFPAFGQLRQALQQWLIDSLIPASIADSVMRYLTQFAGQASELGLAGFAGLTLVSVSLMLTIDKTLNQIWRASQTRPLGQRVLVYWAALTLGPLVMGASLAISSYVVTASRGWLPDLPGGVDAALAALQLLLMAGGLTLLYRFVPNTPVRWRHALAGALFVTVCLGLARHGLGLYLTRIPTYSVIYGTLATLPILLLWIYLAWLIVLLGAVIAAYLPSLLSGVARRGGGPGWDFRLAVEVLQALAAARDGAARGLTLPQLAQAARVDALQLSPALAVLAALDWVGQLDTRGENEEPRHVLLIEPARQPLRPLAERLLLAPDEALSGWWTQVLHSEATVADVLPPAASNS